MWVKRRRLLSSLSLGILGLGSGCLANGTNAYETEGADDDPIDVTAGELVLETHQLEGGGWEIDREHEYGDTHHSRYFSNGEYMIVNNIYICESVAAATRSLEASEEVEKNQRTWDGTHEIGSDGFTYSGLLGPGAVVRDANVIGSVLLLGSEYEELVFRTAITMHETWR